jgi:HEAT repeat protein
VVWRAAAALDKIGDKRAVEPLIAALKNKDPEVAWRAAAALGKIGDKRAVEPLIAALKNKDPEVQKSAADALAKIGSPPVKPLIAMLDDADPEVKKLASDLLIKIGSPAVKPLILALKHKDPELQKSAADVLVKIGSTAVRPLIAMLDDEDPEVQELAADVLAKIGQPAVETLIAALNDKSDTIRVASAGVLGIIGDKQAVHSLVEALTDWKVRHSAAMALDSLEWKPVIPSNRIHYLYAKGQKDALLDEWELTDKILLNDIRSGTQKSIQYAVYAFIDLKGDYIIPELIKTLKSDRKKNMAKAYVKPLMAALKNKDPEVQKSAADALVKIGQLAVGPLITALDDEDPEVQKSAADVLVKIGSPAVGPLMTAVKNKSDTIRVASATVLGRIDDKRAVHPLVEALTDLKARHSAAMALDSLEWKPVIPSNRIHYLYAKGQKNELLDEWELTNKILSDDLRSGTQKSIQNAVYAFIDLKGDYIIPELIKILDSTGDVFIAQVYLDSGHQELMEFARRWADRHGFNAASETNNVGLKGR